MRKIIGLSVTLIFLMSLGEGVFSQGEMLVESEAAMDTAAAQDLPAPQPPSNVKVADKPNDAGHGLILTWEASADDGAGMNNVQMYEIFRASSPDGEFQSRGYKHVGLGVDSQNLSGATRLYKKAGGLVLSTV